MNFKPLFGGVLLAVMAASAWTIDGTVTDKAGSPLAFVKIDGFNYGGYSTTSDAQGKFNLSNEGTEALPSITAMNNLSVKRDGFNLNITNPSKIAVKVSLMDALGKVQAQKEFNSASASIDLKKFGNQKLMIVKVASNSESENYVLANGALMKAGDPMAMLQFAKEGYVNLTYTMKAEVETGVIIVMEKVGETPVASSSSEVKPAVSSSSVTPSSSSVAPVSSSSVELVVNCAGKTYAAGEHNMSITVDGKQRTFIMRVPSAYKGDKPVPLVVDYHPIGGQSASHMNSSGYKTYTDALGGISLYPQGTTKTMGPGWNVGPCCSYDDDIKFSREMIKKVEELVCIDTKRVYAAGFSMGGGMSNHVACNMSDIFAAVAPAAMDLNTVNSASCNTTRPISIIMFRGTNDNVCRYEGGDSGFNDGLNFLGAKKNFKFWGDKNGCNTASSITNSDGCEEYTGCKDGVRVVLCTKQGGGHEYGDAKVGWPFLNSFTMP